MSGQVDSSLTFTHDNGLFHVSLTDTDPVNESQIFNKELFISRLTFAGEPGAIWRGISIESRPGISIYKVSSPATKLGMSVISKLHFSIKNELLAVNQLALENHGTSKPRWVTTVTDVSKGVEGRD